MRNVKKSGTFWSFRVPFRRKKIWNFLGLLNLVVGPFWRFQSGNTDCNFHHYRWGERGVFRNIANMLDVFGSGASAQFVILDVGLFGFFQLQPCSCPAKSLQKGNNALECREISYRMWAPTIGCFNTFDNSAALVLPDWPMPATPQFPHRGPPSTYLSPIFIISFPISPKTSPMAFGHTNEWVKVMLRTYPPCIRRVLGNYSMSVPSSN